jgi:hypothetical protein
MESPLQLLPLECTQAHSHHEQNKIQTVTVNLTQCDCLYPCPFHNTSLFHGRPTLRRRSYPNLLPPPSFSVPELITAMSTFPTKKLIFLHDSKSNLKFLVDSGSSILILPHSSSAPSTGPHLVGLRQTRSCLRPPLADRLFCRP